MPESPRVLIHVGNPDAELPHKSFVRVEKLFEKFPTVRFVCILWDKAECKRVGEEIAKVKRPDTHPGFEVIYWDTDAELMDYLCGKLQDYIGAKIVSPGWYTCKGEAKHITGRTMDKALDMCPECGKEVEYQTEYMERFNRFAMVFAKVTQLINFDTRSGEVLNLAVNPTSNVLFNMPYALPVDPERVKHVDFDSLKGQGKGRPAYLVSAGPTLEDMIPHLKRLQDTGLILSVGRSYKLLRQHGIRVDYAFSCEMFAWDSVIFDDVGDVGDTVMCYPPVCAPTTVQKWPGKRCCMWDINTAELVNRKTWIIGGNSVSHHMINFAVQVLEASPLILIGADMSYPKNRTHAQGTFHAWPKESGENEQEYHGGEEWYPSNGKGELETGCFKIQADPRKAAPIGPILVRTSPAYLNFLRLTEILLARHKTKAWNTSPGGVVIEGAPYLDLATYEPAGQMTTLPA